MTEDNQILMDAKKSLKSHIKFIESLIKHINGNDETFKSRALWTAWCLERYFNEKLMDDIQSTMMTYSKNSANDET